MRRVAVQAADPFRQTDEPGRRRLAVDATDVPDEPPWRAATQDERGGALDEQPAVAGLLEADAGEPAEEPRVALSHRVDAEAAHGPHVGWPLRRADVDDVHLALAPEAGPLGEPGAVAGRDPLGDLDPRVRAEPRVVAEDRTHGQAIRGRADAEADRAVEERHSEPGRAEQDEPRASRDGEAEP